MSSVGSATAPEDARQRVTRKHRDMRILAPSFAPSVGSVSSLRGSQGISSGINPLQPSRYPRAYAWTSRLPSLRAISMMNNDREGLLPAVLEMKFDAAVIPSPVFRFPRHATRNHAIRQKDQVLEFRVRHFLPDAGIISKWIDARKNIIPRFPLRELAASLVLRTHEQG